MAKMIRKKSMAIVLALAMVVCLLPVMTMPASASVTYDGTSFLGSDTEKLTDGGHFVVTGQDGNGSKLMYSDEYGICLRDEDGYSEAAAGVINIASADSGAVFTMSSITVSVCHEYTFEITYGSSDTVVASVTVDPNDSNTYDSTQKIAYADWYYKTFALEPQMTDAVHVSITSEIANPQVGNHTAIVGFTAEGYPGTPSTVTTGSVTDAASTSATMGGNVTDAVNAEVTDRGVVYSTTDETPMIGETGVTQDANGTGTGSFSKSITGLTPSKTYYVRAYATNSVGTSYGSVVNFTTGAANTAPTFVDSGDGSLTVAKNAGATDITSLLHVSDTDSSQTLTWSQSSAPSHGTLNVESATASSGSTDITPGGTITYTPNAEYSGTDTFTVQVSDGIATATRTINVTVDGTAPTVSSVSVPSSGTYKIGDTLSFTVNFNEAVTVTTDGGTPYIPLTFNTGGTVNALYASGSGSSALVFSYTVASGNQDMDGISVSYSIMSNGGTFKDALGNNADLQLNSVGSTTSVKIDAIAPTVWSVSVPTDGTYKVGDTLSFMVNFTEAVTVGGAPYIPVTLDTGGAVNASYVSGNGTPALVFSYTVASGNLDADGIVVGSSITANGGTLRDATGNDATLTFNSVGSTGGVLIDAVAPAVSSASVAADNSYIDVTFSKGIYGANDGIAALEVGDLGMTFAQNSGAATNAVINSIKKADNVEEASAAELTGGETTVRVFLMVSGSPAGTETIEIKPTGGASIYDKAGNAMDANQTTGAKNLTDKTAPTVSSVFVPLNGTYKAGDTLSLTVNFSKAVTVTGAPYIPVTLDAGGTVNATYASGSGTSVLAFSYTVAYGNLDADGISVGSFITANGGTFRDAAGNDAALTLNSVGNATGVLVDAVAPTASVTTQTVSAGADVTVQSTETGAVYLISNTLDSTACDTVSELDALVSGGSATKVTISAANTDTTITPSSSSGAYAAVAVDAVGNISAKTENIVIVDATVPTITDVIRTDNTHITVTLSEACQNLIKSNDGGFTITQTGTATTYVVSATAQGSDSNHVVLTVDNMSLAGAAGVTVTYTAGEHGTIADTAGNVLATDSAGKAISAWVSSGGGGSSSGSSSNNGATVIVNGETKTAGTAQTTTNSRGQTTTTVTVDTSKLENILASHGANATVTIPVTGGSDVAVGILNGAMVKSMESKDATLVVQTDSGAYTLPASEINIDAVSQQLGTTVSLSDIAVTVSIAEPSASMTQVVENAAQDGGFTIIVPAVDYTITCTHGSQTVNVSSFNAYVERTIAIPDSADPTKITTGVVVDPDGTTHHVPTRITVMNGKYYAVINSLTNSTYSVIWNPVKFSDVVNHWAKDSINDMGSRMVVTGVGNNNYDPSRTMTRAEFAAIMVRALGLEPGTGASGFGDVNSADWYCGYIKTAALYGLIKGYDNGNFGADNTITREQAMTMITRAMTITKLSVRLSDSEINQLLSTFSDGESASSYAKESIAACLKTGITSGTSNTTILPKADISRAEVVVMVQRLLQKSGLI